MRLSSEELVVREIIGPGRGDTRAFGYAIETARRLLFEEKRCGCMGEISVSVEIYERVAKRLNRKSGSVTRQIQRMGERCWNSMEEEQRLRYIGKSSFPEGSPNTRDILFYLAFYCHYGEAYYLVLKKERGLRSQG